MAFWANKGAEYDRMWLWTNNLAACRCLKGNQRYNSLTGLTILIHRKASIKIVHRSPLGNNFITIIVIARIYILLGWVGFCNPGLHGPKHP